MSVANRRKNGERRTYQESASTLFTYVNTRGNTMKLVLGAALVAVVLALAGAATFASADSKPSHESCSSARSALSEHRGEMVGLHAAYRISVEHGWDGHIAKLGPRMLAGEARTDQLLRAMYAAC